MRHTDGAKRNKDNNLDRYRSGFSRFDGLKKAAFTLSCKSFLSGKCSLYGKAESLTLPSLNRARSFHSYLSRKRYTVSFSFGRVPYAFTLSEVLISLVIIGVIAALTLPVIMENYTKRTIETRLQKFYSTMNYAVRRAEVDFGDKREWWRDITDKTEAKEWFKTYLAPYLSITKIDDSSTLIIYFNDGTSLERPNSTTRDWVFYPGSITKCKKLANAAGVCKFLFIFCPVSSASAWTYHYNKGFEPFKYYWNGTKEGLYTTGSYPCVNNGAYCTAIIQNNGWKIPDDYPHRVSL